MNTLTHKELTQDEIDMYLFYRKKGIKAGFFERYFEKLKTENTTIEAFRATNKEYFELFGEYRYSAIRSFRKCLNDYLRK